MLVPSNVDTTNITTTSKTRKTRQSPNFHPMINFFSKVMSNFASDVFTVKPAPRRKTDIDTPLQVLSRCAQACNYGHCTLLSETWFTRVLSLERKRTERSRKPFLLVLLDIEGVGE